MGNIQISDIEGLIIGVGEQGQNAVAYMQEHQLLNALLLSYVKLKRQLNQFDADFVVIVSALFDCDYDFVIEVANQCNTDTLVIALALCPEVLVPEYQVCINELKEKCTVIECKPKDSWYWANQYENAANTVYGLLSSLFDCQSLIGVDYAEIKLLLKSAKHTRTAYVTASGEGRAEEAANLALAQLIDITAATGLYANVIHGSSLLMSEFDVIAARLLEQLPDEADVKVCMTFNRDQEPDTDTINLFVLVTD